MEIGPRNVALGSVAGLVSRSKSAVGLHKKKRAAVPGTAALGVVATSIPWPAENPARGTCVYHEPLRSIPTVSVSFFSSFLPLASFFPDFTGFEVFGMTVLLDLQSAGLA
jgi:hypothetical protein